MKTTAASLVRQLAAELHALDRRRVQVLHAMHALSQLMGTTTHLSAGTNGHGWKGHKRTLDTKLYNQTLSLLRAAHVPLTMLELRQHLRARKLPLTSAYAHIRRAVAHGDVVRASGRRFRALTAPELAKRKHEASLATAAKIAAIAAGKAHQSHRKSEVRAKESVTS